ncbi:MAG: alpha/beta hydrolase [Pseudomonadales bacterium]|nr:alpha/beta hydrolase [Pseudomonadales bacterium]
MATHFESGGVSIRYIDRGDGPAVILVHGFTGNSASWTELQEELAKTHRVIALDCRGHGQSGKPDHYGLAMVTDLIGLLDHLNIECATLVGYSMGAEIVLRTVVAYPDRVDALVVAGSGWSGTLDEANYLGLSQALESSGSFGPMLANAGPEGQVPSAEDIAQVDALLAENDTKALAKVAADMGEIIHLTESDIKGISVPTLAITGALDPERANLERLQGAMTDLSLIIIPGADHMRAFLHADFSHAVVRFVTR